MKEEVEKLLIAYGSVVESQGYNIPELEMAVNAIMELVEKETYGIPRKILRNIQSGEDAVFNAEEIADLLSQQKKEIVEKIDKKYPPTFINEYEYGKAIMERGKQELTEIRRLSQEEKQILADIIKEIEG